MLANQRCRCGTLSAFQHFIHCLLSRMILEWHQRVWQRLGKR